MEELLELAHIIKFHSQRSLQLVNQNFRKKEKSKDNLLHALIVNEKIYNDEQAAKRLLNTHPANRNFRNAKSKLRLKLMNHLFFLDLDKPCYSEFKKVHYDCILRLSQFKILVLEGKSWLILKRIPALIKIALEYDLVEIALEGLSILRNEYSKMGKYNLQNNLEKKIIEIKPLYRAIIECEALYYDTLGVINKSNNSCEKILNTLPARIHDIERKSKEFNNRRLDVLAKLLSIYYNGVCRRNDKILQLCDYLENNYIPEKVKKIKINIDASVIASIKLDAWYRLSDSVNFELYCNRKISLFVQGSPKWFTFMEYWFLLLMKSEKYNRAVEIFKQVKANSNFSRIERSIIERWLIYRAYLCYSTDCRAIQWGFNPDKYFSSKTGFAELYSCYGFAVLVARMLFSLREGKTSAVKETINEMMKYSSDHLDKRHNYRNSLLIRMLGIMVELKFDYHLIIEKNMLYYQKLNENHISADLTVELEVVPYEKLWNHILEILNSNKHYTHFRFYHSHEV